MTPVDDVMTAVSIRSGIPREAITPRDVALLVLDARRERDALKAEVEKLTEQRWALRDALHASVKGSSSAVQNAFAKARAIGALEDGRE